MAHALQGSLSNASVTSKEGFEKAEIDGVHLECAL